MLEDASILRNAFQFATAQRAFVGYNILRQPLEHLNQEALAFFAAEAYMAEMTSTEDMLGWLFVLRDWRPGEVGLSLLPLLDSVQVGRGRHSEQAATDALDTLDPSALRELLHIPSDHDLEGAGFPPDVREGINRAMPANLDGMKRLVGLRQEAGRLRVRAFNKLKHHFLAIRREGSPGSVIVPVWENLDEVANAITMATMTIECTAESVRLMASRSIIAQAVLNSLLGIILWTRFDEPHDSPPWAIGAFRMRGWAENAP